MTCIQLYVHVHILHLLSFFFLKQVLDKVRDLLNDVDLFDDFYKCEFMITWQLEQADFIACHSQI